MTIVALVLGVALAAGAVLLVALPFLREPQAADDRLDAPTVADEVRFGLIDERDRALGALKELEFDHRTGKITDDDYRRDVGPLRQAAASALRRIDDNGRSIETKEVRMNELQPVPEPSPPPDEGTPPAPAPVPEPYPPPDEADLPTVPQE